MNQSPRIDPLSKLTTELFNRIVSSLPPQDLLSSKAVSKTWKAAIDSDPPIQQVEQVNNGSGQHLFIQNLDQLVPLTSTQVVKLTLDLSCLLKDLPPPDETGWENPVAKCFAFFRSFHKFESTIEPLKQSLQEIEFHLEKKPHQSGIVDDLLTSLKSLIEKFPGLERIGINVPGSLSLKAGVDSPGQKFFGITSNDPGEDLDAESVLEVMKLALGFVGNGLKEFILPFRKDANCFGHEESNWNEGLGSSKESRIEDFFEELLKSKDTLQTIDLKRLDSIKGELIWNFILKCSNLTSLSVSLNHPPRTQGLVEWLKVSEEEVAKREKKIKKLELQASGYPIEWELFLKWIGEGELENIELINTYNLSPQNLQSLLVPSRTSLKTLHLYSAGKSGFFNCSSSLFGDNEDSIFPNLESFKLSSDLESCFGFFKNLKSPKLKTLECNYMIEPFDYQGPKGFRSIIFFRALTSFLVGNSESLEEVELDWDCLVASIKCGRNPSVTFDRLRKLKFEEVYGLDPFLEWFSGCQFPNLTKLHGCFEKELYESFEINAPLLPPQSNDDSDEGFDDEEEEDDDEIDDEDDNDFL